MLTAADSDLLSIGDLSHRSQTPVKTLRYYEELGLIQGAQHPSGEQPQFAADCLPRLAIIKQAKGLGLSLPEIGHILTLHDQSEQPCAQVTHTLRSKIEVIEQRIQALNQLKAHLHHLITETERAPQPAIALDGIIAAIAPASGRSTETLPVERPGVV